MKMRMVCQKCRKKFAGVQKQSFILIIICVLRGIIRAAHLNSKAICSNILALGIFPVLCLSVATSEAASDDAAKMQPDVISGYTMGTVYRIVLPGTEEKRLIEIKGRIQDHLEAINSELSVFEPQSLFSLFNKMSAGEILCVSSGFQEIMRVARKVHHLSDGSFDPTAAPLIDAWGFGESGFTWQKPGSEEIEAALELVGLEKVHMDESGCVSKEKDGVRLNLSAVAKGYAVDGLAVLLENLGVESYLVSIGGDMRASGPKPDGSNWRIGINMPFPVADLRDKAKELEITSGALATSGNYRNYFRVEDKVYSHIIDPSTGYPAAQGTVSATVLADSCVMADALATALMTMDSASALKMINSLDNIEALIIQLTPDGEYVLYESEGF